jgi:UDP-N-acetylmuramate--alanine ligase
MDEKTTLPQTLAGYAVHLVGIKGTGMAALAEVLLSRRARVTGSDTPETFYTDAILDRLGIRYAEGFSEKNIPDDAKLVVHSAAYGVEDNVELAAAVKRGIPHITYPQALGSLSAMSDSSGVSGVHGKSTTTALCGVILKAWGMPATVIVGAEVPAFGGRSTLVQGEKYLVAETCEYRRHFLNFHPSRIVITSIEPDHLDYFEDMEDILDAFIGYGESLPADGTVIYCADDPGAAEAAVRIRKRRKDLRMVAYGMRADGDFRITGVTQGPGETRFTLACSTHEFKLAVPGEHTVLNATGAIALCTAIWRKEKKGAEPDLAAASEALSAFAGSRRRSEIVGDANGVLFIDDYAHHPTAIEKTLAGYRSFYSGRRLVVDFMPHMYSRTKALLHEFGRSFSSADIIVLHKIYPSAREGVLPDFSGRRLFDEVSANHPAVSYFEEPLGAVPFLKDTLRKGDVFVTMGAGDNWKLGRELLRIFGGTT